MFNSLAVVCLGFCAAFSIYTTQVFFQKVEGQETQQADLSQNLAAVLQVVGLGAGGAAALTKGGRQSLEKLFTTLRLPPQKQAPTALAIATGMTAITGTVAASLPIWGKNYINDGQKYIQATQWLKAQDSFVQAKKFISSNEDKAKVEIGLGKSYEHMGDLTKAKEHYRKAAALDNIEGMSRFARLSLVDFFLKNPPKSRTQPSASDENLRQAQLYNKRAWLKIWKNKAQSSDNFDKEEIELTQIARTNDIVITAIQDLMVFPKNNQVLKDQDYRARYWNESIVGVLKSNLDEVKNLKIPKDDSLYLKPLCFAIATHEQMLHTENITSNLGDLPGLVPGEYYASPDGPNCHDDKALSIYDFALIEAWSKIYKLPKYTRVASPNTNQAIRNNNQPGVYNQPGNYNPNYPSR